MVCINYKNINISSFYVTNSNLRGGTLLNKYYNDT